VKRWSGSEAVNKGETGMEIYGGYRWERQTKDHLRNPKFLESYGYKVYSQNDEDGILQEIFDRIGTETKKFVEFGVQDGLECNSHYLLHKGWTGLWLEGSRPLYQQIQDKFEPVISKGLLKTDCVFITRENINAILVKNGIGEGYDLLSIDVDGNDYYIWEAISVISPRVVCIEYNGKFPPDYEWVMPYFSEHVWQGNDYFGASLKALEKLGHKKGYQLVGTNLTGVNAFFVRADLAKGKFPEPATAENLYNAPQYERRHITGHPNEFCLIGEDYFRPRWAKKPELSEYKIEIESCKEEFEKQSVRIDATAYSQDMLFEILERNALTSEHLIIENGLHDYGKGQVVLCFIERYKIFVEYTYISEEKDETWKFYIKLKGTINDPQVRQYSVLADTYTEKYYLTDCGGYDDFKVSNGVEITPRLKDVYNLIDPQIGERILDVGCGRGELTFAIAMSGAQAEGIDYSKEAIALAKRTFDGKSENLKYTFADIFTMETLCSFDKIVMADVVEHIEQDILEKIFEKISKSLNKDGKLIIHTAPNKDYYELFYPKIREQAGSLGCWKPENPRSYYEQLMHINEQTPTVLEQALSRYFQYVKVWTGCVTDIDTEKTSEEKNKDIDIFAIASQKRDVLEKTIERFTKEPELKKCHIKVEAEDINVPYGQKEILVPVTLINLGTEIISSRKKYPINLAYHILDDNGNIVVFDGIRTPVYDFIGNRQEKHLQMKLQIPNSLDRAKSYTIVITLVAEGCFWFDLEGENKTDVSLCVQ